MDFPITHEKIRAYAAQHDVDIKQDIRETLRRQMNLDPGYIVTELKLYIDESIELKHPTYSYHVNVGDIKPLTTKYDRECVKNILITEFLNPLIQHFFPIATPEIIMDRAYLAFNLPVPLAQTSSPSQ